MDHCSNILNIKNLCRTCFSEKSNTKITDTRITIDDYSKDAVDLLKLLTTIEVSY